VIQGGLYSLTIRSGVISLQDCIQGQVAAIPCFNGRGLSFALGLQPAQRSGSPLGSPRSTRRKIGSGSPDAAPRADSKALRNRTLPWVPCSSTSRSIEVEIEVDPGTPSAGDRPPPIAKRFDGDGLEPALGLDGGHGVGGKLLYLPFGSICFAGGGCPASRRRRGPPQTACALPVESESSARHEVHDDAAKQPPSLASVHSRDRDAVDETNCTSSMSTAAHSSCIGWCDESSHSFHTAKATCACKCAERREVSPSTSTKGSESEAVLGPTHTTIRSAKPRN
jgi:hypothetical protein